MKVGRMQPNRRFKIIPGVIAGVIFVLLLVVGGVAWFAHPAADHPFFETDRPVWVIAHRGGRGLWPEETLYAFKEAVRLGVDVIEFDLQRSKDGIPVVIHDATLERTTDGTGAVAEHTVAELKKLDAAFRWSPDGGRTFPLRGQGIRIPTLAEVFEALPRMRMNFEIKAGEATFADTVCGRIRQFQMSERLLAASFNSQVLQRFRDVCPEVATSAGFSEAQGFYLLQKIRLHALHTPGVQALQVPEYFRDIHVVTPGFVAAAHDRNLEVHVWTVNDADSMQRLLAIGVDGIITDYPDRLMKLLDRQFPAGASRRDALR